MFKQILTAAVVALGVVTAPIGLSTGAAHAASVGDAIPVAGVDSIDFASGFLTTDGSGAFAFTPIPFSGSQAGSILQFDTVASDAGVLVTQQDPLALPFPIPSFVLTADAAMDVVSSSNGLGGFVVEALYTATSNSLDAAFGTFLLEIVSPFPLDPLTTALGSTVPSLASAKIIAVNVIPLPATGLLLIGGLGGFAVLRRKKRKAAA